MKNNILTAKERSSKVPTPKEAGTYSNPPSDDDTGGSSKRKKKKESIFMFKKNQRYKTHYGGTYTGVVDDGKYIDNPTGAQAQKAMLEYLQNNHQDSNIMRPEFIPHDSNTIRRRDKIKVGDSKSGAA